MNAEINAETLLNKQNCIDYFSWTYLFRRIIKNPPYYGLKDSSAKEVNKYLVNLVDKCVQRLVDHGCIKCSDGYNLEGTFLGYLSSFYYIKNETVHFFDQNLKNNMEIKDLILILSSAHEFDEIPLRHNEDIMNENLAKLVPFEVDRRTFDSPNTKTNLLL
jgi:activating signal cointegrator complex subunit 3